MARQLFDDACEQGIKAQITKEFYAMHSYQAMAAHFERDDVALPNIAKFFRDSASEEKEHAEKLIDYLNKRGGRNVFEAIPAPKVQVFESALHAFETALALEKEVNEALLQLHGVSDSKNDYQMSDFLEGEYLKEQVDGIKQLADYCTQLRMLKSSGGLGEYQFEKTFRS